MRVVEEKNLGEDASSSQGKIAVLSRFSTLTEVEVKDVVQVKDVVVAVATKIKANINSNQAMRRDQTLVDEDSPEARGEVAEIIIETMQIMITENVGVVEEQVTLNVTVHPKIRVVEDSIIIMRQPAGTQMIQKGCLSCSICQILCLQMYQSVVIMYGMWIRVLRIT